MANIVVNKNFNQKYLSKSYLRLFQCDYDINTWYSGVVWSDYGWHSGYGSNIQPTYYNQLHTAITGNGDWQGVSDGNYNDIYSYSYNYAQYPTNVLICSEKFITLLDKINKEFKKSTITLPKVNVNIRPTTDTSRTRQLDMKYLVNTIFHGNINVRNSAIQYFVGAELITQEEADFIKTTTAAIKLSLTNPYDRAPATADRVIKKNDMTYTQEDTLFNMKITRPLSLDNTYKNINNPEGVPMYVLFIPYSSTQFNKYYYSNEVIGYHHTYATDLDLQDGNGQVYRNSDNNKTHLGYQTFHKKDTNTVVRQIPYVALSIGTTGSGSDIEYDYMDTIDYLDGVEFKVSIPKKYS